MGQSNSGLIQASFCPAFVGCCFFVLALSPGKPMFYCWIWANSIWTWSFRPWPCLVPWKALGKRKSGWAQSHAHPTQRKLVASNNAFLSHKSLVYLLDSWWWACYTWVDIRLMCQESQSHYILSRRRMLNDLWVWSIFFAVCQYLAMMIPHN